MSDMAGDVIGREVGLLCSECRNALANRPEPRQGAYSAPLYLISRDVARFSP